MKTDETKNEMNRNAPSPKSRFASCARWLTAVAFGLAGQAGAATIRVPLDQPTIAAGIAAANPGDTVSVSPGTYYEYNIPVAKSITIASGGNATNTIVDMQHNGRGFMITNPSPTAVSISGLTIQNASIPYYTGGGAILVASGKCRISGCIVQGTSGAADYSGGPISNWGTNVDDVVVDNCVVRNNFAANGCGIGNCAANKCLIYDNSAGNNPMALSGCHATNCTVYNNTGGFLANAWTAGGMSGGIAVNCIFWANSGHNGQQIDPASSAVVGYSTIQGGYSGTGNISSDPLFVNAAGGDFHLQASSPAKNTGDPSILNSDGSRSDMGAYGGIFPSPSDFLTNGLIAYYPFNGNANDASGHGNHGQFIGNVIPATDRFGNAAAAYHLDGASGSIDVTNTVFNIGQAGYTMSGWFCSDDVTKFEQCVINTIPHTGIGLELNNRNTPGRLFYGIGPADAFWTVINASGVKNDYANQAWYHLAFTKNGTSYTLYINGQIDAQQTVPVAAGYNYNVGYLFGAIQGGSQVFKGRLDDFRVYNRGLSSDQVAQLFALESASNSPPCIPHTALANPTVVNGFIVGANISDGGCGYTNTPMVRIIGGDGSGAQAVAVVSNGVVTAVNVQLAGAGYTNNPIIVISPPFIPHPTMIGTLLLSGPFVTSVLKLDLADLSPYDNYQLEFSSNAGGTWSNFGSPFSPIATTTVLNVNASGNIGFFRVKYVQ